MRFLTIYHKRFVEFLAQLLLQKHRPSVIAIVGASAKSIVGRAIYTVLRSERQVETGGDFLKTILGKKPLRSLLRKKGYSEILLLKYPAERPGMVRQLLNIAKPKIAIVLNTSAIPPGMEFYSSPKAAVREGTRVIEALPAAGLAVLNSDDEAVMGMREKTRAHIITFGFGGEAQIKIFNFVNRSEQLPAGQWRPTGISFKLEHENSFVPIHLDGVFGKIYAYAAAAAAAVGLSYGMNLIKIAEALHYYQAPPGRMKLIPGIKSTFIIDDSGGASFLSTQLALETISELKAARKVAVLGDVLGLGKYAVEAHENLGRFCRDKIDVLIAVGLRAKFIAAAAVKNGFNKNRVLSFDTADQAKLEVQSLLKKGDLVLVKGAKEMELSKVVHEIQLI